MATADAPENARRAEDPSEEFQESAFFSRRCCCLWNFPCSISRRRESWERISPSVTELPESGGRSWWGRGVDALKKVREWSEMVAGPKWKTFIRRFNRTGARPKSGKFNYDPMSYALNFDEGHNGQFEDDRIFRDFSSRYAAIPVQGSGQLK
ncbi:NHL domain-containing protein [Striga asiatica]|uniref:NHL domain-containing protein n=1 Tax=Striga asiatica TaxID=4170 RepID=A0A5A7Q7W3_STRAF|nr:NHL domain-containing protein [Striga asiatica]